jgi:glycosyltransferase involved in cell wall biosynthesis
LPRFTVVVPTYKRNALLARALQSVRAQTFGDFEVLVVDDGSPSAPTDVVDAVQDARFRMIVRPKNGGAAAARNDGIRAAQGDWVAFLDSDDAFEPTFLEVVERNLRARPDAEIGWTSIRAVRQTPAGDEDLGTHLWDPRTPPGRPTHLAALKTRRVGTGHGLFVKREVFERVGVFDTSLTRSEDADLVIRILRTSPYVAIADVVFLHHQHDGERLTTHTSAAKFATATEAIMRNNLDVLADHPKLHARYAEHAARLFYQAGDRANARRMMSHALRASPTTAKTWIALALHEVAPKSGPKLFSRLARMAR